MRTVIIHRTDHSDAEKNLSFDQSLQLTKVYGIGTYEVTLLKY